MDIVFWFLVLVFGSSLLFWCLVVGCCIFCSSFFMLKLVVSGLRRCLATPMFGRSGERGRRFWEGWGGVWLFSFWLSV